MKLREFVDRIVADGVITPDERAELCRIVVEDPDLTQEERDEIGRISAMVDRGELIIVDRALEDDSGDVH